MNTDNSKLEIGKSYYLHGVGYPRVKRVHIESIIPNSKELFHDARLVVFRMWVQKVKGWVWDVRPYYLLAIANGWSYDLVKTSLETETVNSKETSILPLNLLKNSLLGKYIKLYNFSVEEINRGKLTTIPVVRYVTSIYKPECVARISYKQITEVETIYQYEGLDFNLILEDGTYHNLASEKEITLLEQLPKSYKGAVLTYLENSFIGKFVKYIDNGIIKYQKVTEVTHDFVGGDIVSILIFENGVHLVLDLSDEIEIFDQNPEEHEIKS